MSLEECDSCFDIDIQTRSPSETDPKLRNESSSPMDVILEFNLQIFKKWFDGRGRFRRRVNEPAVSRFICVDYTAPPDELKRLLAEELETCGMGMRDRCTKDRFVAVAISLGRTIGREYEGKLVLVFYIIKNIYYIEDDRNYLDGTKMVPASTESILSLPKKKKEDGDEIESCSICLDEISVGDVVSTLQCSHIFHGDCILKWLNKSHYCPMCRFEMPIGE